MTLSELIIRLEIMKCKYGDITVYVEQEVLDDYDITFEKSIKDPLLGQYPDRIQIL